MERQELIRPPDTQLMTDVAKAARGILGLEHENDTQPEFLGNVIVDVHNQLYGSRIRNVSVIYGAVLHLKVTRSLNRHTKDNNHPDNSREFTVSDGMIGGI